MDVNDLQKLTKLIKLCRKNGIEHVKVSSDGIEFSLREEPRRTRKASKVEKSEAEASFLQPEYSIDEILNWSSGPGTEVQG